MPMLDHKPVTPRRDPTLWFYFTDTPGLTVVVALHLLIGLAEAVLIFGFGRGSWATDPIAWVHGPPLDVPIGRGGGVTYSQVFLGLAMLTIAPWAALVSRPDWPRWPQAVLAVVAALLVLVHLVMLAALL